jgi:two-component system LytT family response regulator
MTLSPIKVVIVEDQAEIREYVNYLVQRQDGFKIVGNCGTVKEARSLIIQWKPDLLLLDVHLPDGTGFDVLHEMPGEYKIIFLTGFEKHAVQAIRIGALDYILKPIDEAEFSQALAKVPQYFPAQSEQLNLANQYHQGETRSRLVLRSPDYLQVVEINQIIYCKSDSGYTTFYLIGDRKVLVSKILKDYEGILPNFLRVHQSYLVNCSYIDGYDKEGFIRLKNSNERIPVASRRKEAVLDFFNHLS